MPSYEYPISDAVSHLDLQSAPSPHTHPTAQIKREINRLQDRVAALEAENTALRTKLEAVTADVDRNSQDLKDAFQNITPMRKLLIGEGHDEAPVEVMKELREQQGPLNQQLGALDERITDQENELREEIEREVGVLRAQQNARLRHLASETNVDLELTAGDTITRVREDGVDAVRAAPRKRDRRAEIVLQNIEDWGTKERLRAGPAYRLPRPRVTRLLNRTDDVAVTMTSKTVGDVFDAIEELAAGSTRLIRRRKDDGVDNLYVGFPETESTE